MNGKLWRVAASLLPVCLLSAQQPAPQAPRQPNPKILRRAAEAQRRMRERAIAIDSLAGHIQSPEDARKLVELVAGAFSPARTTRSMRRRVARAEYQSAAEGALIPEQRVANAWNGYLENIGALREDHVTAEEIHVLRDSLYVAAQVLWVRGSQNVWTVPSIYAIGPDGKVAVGCRALEAERVLWQLASQPQVLEGTRVLIKNGKRWSDEVKNPSKPPAPGTAKGYVSAGLAPPNPVRQSADRFSDEHGARALNRAQETLIDELFAD